jgi:polysaccharide export outer membrane protein
MRAKSEFSGQRVWRCLLSAAVAMGLPALAGAQAPSSSPNTPEAQTRRPESIETIQNYNRQLQQLEKELENEASLPKEQDYRVGREDLVEISVFEAPEFSSIERVSASGEISVPMLGAVHAAGLTPRELESVLAELLRRTYMKDPHVSVFVKEMQSHSVSVFGAVRKPGVLQIRGAKTLVEVLSLSEGLADDAGDTVLVTHRGEPASLTAAHSALQSVQHEAEPANDSNGSSHGKDLRDIGSGTATATDEINLRALLEFRDPGLNVMVYPGDSITVPHAGIVYVVGEVRRPGGFQLKGNVKVTVLQALALAEGLTRTAARGRARIMRTDQKTGARTEIPIDLEKVLSGKLLDPPLQSRDVLFVPNSTGRSAFNRALEAAIGVGSGLAIYRF